MTKILDNAVDGPDGNPEPLGNNVLSIKGGLHEDMLLGGFWDVVPVPHGQRCGGGKEDRDDGWHGAGWCGGRREAGQGIK